MREKCSYAIMELMKVFARRLGVGDELRRAAVRMALASERARFSMTGRPEPSSAVVVAGSGRSGTTWLADLLSANLRAQQIFEPLNPWRSATIGGVDDWDVVEPCAWCLYLDVDGEHPKWEIFLGQVLRGEIRNEWTDFKRTHLFPKQFMVKTVRANLMLDYIYDKFQPRIIYLVRHPCAVIHSRLALGWQADVRHILRQEALVEMYLRPWVAAIEKERDLLGAHAVWWAVENFVASRELATRPHYNVAYEELCLEPEREIGEICSWLGGKMRPGLEHLIERPSRTSRGEVTYGSITERLSRWKRQFTAEEQQRILGWAERFEIPYYDEHILPSGMPQ